MRTAISDQRARDHYRRDQQHGACKHSRDGRVDAESEARVERLEHDGPGERAMDPAARELAPKAGVDAAQAHLTPGADGLRHGAVCKVGPGRDERRLTNPASDRNGRDMDQQAWRAICTATIRLSARHLADEPSGGKFPGR